jgi:hypothetical protein
MIRELSFLLKGIKFDETPMLAVTVSGLLALAAALSTAGAVFATPSPNSPGQPQVECGEDGLGNGPHGFSTSGFGNAETKYAGSDGTPSLEHANSDKAVSQYDVACLQTTQH